MVQDQVSHKKHKEEHKEAQRKKTKQTKCSICNHHHSRRLSARRDRATLCPSSVRCSRTCTLRSARSCASPVIRPTRFCSSLSKVVNESRDTRSSALSRK